MLNSFFSTHRLVFINEKTDEPVGATKTPEASEAPPSTPAEAADRIRQQGFAMIEKSQQRFEKLLAAIADRGAKQKHTDFAEDAIAQAKYSLEGGVEPSGNSPSEKLGELERHLSYAEKKLEMAIRVDKITQSSPLMKELYEQIQGSVYGLSQERLFLAINDIFEREKNPDKALKLANGAFLREKILSGYPEEPAKPSELVGSTRLGQEQMSKVLEFMTIDLFETLTISAEQMGQLRSFRSAMYRFEGLTFQEIGLLDAQGNVKKEGVEKLLAHEGPREIDPESSAEALRQLLGGLTGMELALQAKAKEKYGQPGKLPTITLAGRPIDLNEVVAEHQQEFGRFTKIFEASTALDQLDETGKRRELPKTVEGLLSFRFDEATGADTSAENKLPLEIKGRLEALGLQEPNIRVIDGRVREIEFKYKGEKIALSLGRYPWDEDKTPYLHLYNGAQKILSRKVNLSNLTSELDALEQYKTKNQTSIDTINKEYFGIINAKFAFDWGKVSASTSLLSAKEMYLGNIVKPRNSNQKNPDPKTVKILERLLPMILANAEALGISSDMTLMEAMLKIYEAPNRGELLAKDYRSTLSGMRQPDSPHFAGVEPEYRYDFTDAKEHTDRVKASRESTDPKYLARKERMQGMKPGAKLEVTFEGKSYTFTLAKRFANYEYSFKLEGFENEEDFKINNVDLVSRDPEQQLKYMLGSVNRRASMDAERILRGTIDPKEVPKRLSIDRKFYKGDLLGQSRFKNLPFNNRQRQLIESINREKGLNLTMHTDKYGRIAFCEVRWQDAKKIDYRMNSYSGNLWRLKTLAPKSSHTRYPFYDVETQFVEDRLKKLEKGR